MNKAAIAIAMLLLAGAAPLAAAPNPLDEALLQLIDESRIIGAQALIGEHDSIVFEKNYGIRYAEDATGVDSATLFCIGSCSKPFASATILALSDSGAIDLSKPIDHWLASFQAPILKATNETARAPSLTELLSHRGGIYSQRHRMTRRQIRFIRDFRLTLEESVEGISRQPLTHAPGTEFLYSGAGYCVAGRVAEVAEDETFEAVFQERIGNPLGLARTTYFPDSDDDNIAAGSAAGSINRSTPHLVNPHRLALVGGSLYSTAVESSRFVRMILQRGHYQGETVLNEASYRNLLSLPFEGRAYGLGWSIRHENERPVELSHSGALASSRAVLRVNLENGRYGIVYYTLSDPKVSDVVVPIVNQAVMRMARN